jgi:hypothetical protein
MTKIECKQFDVGLSFSGKDRAFVEQLYHSLAELGVKAFYDADYKALLAGEELTEHLPTLYRDKCYLFVPILSKNYLESIWARREKRAALERALEQDRFVLPIRLDGTAIPGISTALAYIDGTSSSHHELADIIATKLLLDRVMPSDHYLDRLQVKDYCTPPHHLSDQSDLIICPIGQAHLDLNCKVAFERLWEPHRSKRGSSSLSAVADPIPMRDVRIIVEEAGFNAPSYSLQLSFLDENNNILAHPELNNELPLSQTRLPKEVEQYISELVKNASGVLDGNFNYTFSWTDSSSKSTKYPSNPLNIYRSNVGCLYPKKLAGSGSGPQKFVGSGSAAHGLIAFVFGEIHLKWQPKPS